MNGMLIMVMASSCYYDSEEYLFPDISNDCDTISVTYTQSVVPIIRNHCFSCHSNSTSFLGGSIRLEDYADIKLRVEDNRLLGAITHQSGYSPMPKGAVKLDDCNIETIRVWINHGAPNN